MAIPNKMSNMPNVIKISFIVVLTMSALNDRI
nr:MAG TPA: hypothetical protein [Caudoviricetes sp.]